MRQVNNFSLSRIALSGFLESFLKIIILKIGSKNPAKKSKAEMFTEYYLGLTANCRNVKSQSPTEVVGDAAAVKDVKKIKRIRRVLKENAILQKQLAQNYKGYILRFLLVSADQ